MTGRASSPRNARARCSAASASTNPCPAPALGLAIVRDIAKLYGGNIALNEFPMGGLEVRLELPRAR